MNDINDIYDVVEDEEKMDTTMDLGDEEFDDDLNMINDDEDDLYDELDDFENELDTLSPENISTHYNDIFGDEEEAAGLNTEEDDILNMVDDDEDDFFNVDGDLYEDDEDTPASSPV